MKKAYIIRDSFGQLEDTIITDRYKAERLINASHGRLSLERAYLLHGSMDAAFYEQEFAKSQHAYIRDASQRGREIAEILLEKEAVTINPDDPYTYVSGIRSPIYCDNRRLTFFPKERRAICHAFAEHIRNLNPDVIAGTASSAIPWATWVASDLDKPMVYIRKAGKGYGKNQLIEGGDIRGQNVVVLEDLVSTGGSSLNAVNACRDAGATVMSMMSIFTYEFREAQTKFKDAHCNTTALTNFSTLVDVAAEKEVIHSDKIDMIREWNSNPQQWGPKHGFPNAVPKN